MLKQRTAGLLLAGLTVFLVRVFAAEGRDYSKEPFVIQDMGTKVSFAADGARDWRQVLSVRLQSEAAVRQFGVLSFAYSSESEKTEIEYVRVKKADGSVIETPAGAFLDVPGQVSSVAPMYTDTRQKQVPVKALGVGDVLEYAVHSTASKPEVAGQFWYSQPFINDSVVLKQSLEVRVLKDRYVQVASPTLKPEVHDDGAQRVYLWTHAQLNPAQASDQKVSPAKADVLKVELTSFRTWDEVGKWWQALAAPQMTVTPELAAKAKELTAGLTTEAEKERAIYEFVALRFRYISISLGAGRYRPHSAAEVLANQYGDCKDKHVLFATLLKAAGIEAVPALIGEGMELRPDLPSPAQFNHVITAIPKDGGYVWADTTAEVAPFGMLQQSLRDEQALIIPAAGKAALMRTPMDPPFLSSERINIKGSIAPDGTLTGHFELDLTGDSALVFRSGFRQLAPAQWQALAQQISYSLSYAGEVSDVGVENLEQVEKAFHLSYEYRRKDFPDWKGQKLATALPPLSFGPGAEAEKPKEPFWAGASGTLSYRSSVELPKGSAAAVPPDVVLHSGFADYSAHYSFKDGAFRSEREMTIKKPKIGGEQWAEYQAFTKSLQADQSTLASITEGDKAERLTAAESNPEAAELVARALLAGEAGKLQEAQGLLQRAGQLNDKEPVLWAIFSRVAMSSGNGEQAITYARKEVELHPDELLGKAQLASALQYMGRTGDAIAVLQQSLAKDQADGDLAIQIAGLLLEQQRLAEVLVVLEKPIAAAPRRYDLQVARISALLRGENVAQGLKEAQAIANALTDARQLNKLAHELTGSTGGIELARELAQRAVDALEQNCASINLDHLERKDLGSVVELATGWDTLGWVLFKANDLTSAQRYIEAGWRLGQRAAAADHLGEIYARKDLHSRALRMWQLALASDKTDRNAQLQLQLAGLSHPELLNKAQGLKRPMSAGEQLSKMRSIPLPALPRQNASAEVFLLQSRTGVEDVRFINGSNPVNDADAAIRAAKPTFEFPDEGPEKIVRRAIFYCSVFTDPSCSLTLLLPSATKLEPIQEEAKGIPAINGIKATSPVQEEAKGHSCDPRDQRHTAHSCVESRTALHAGCHRRQDGRNGGAEPVG